MLDYLVYFLIIAIAVLLAVIAVLWRGGQNDARHYQRLFLENPNPMWIYHLETRRFLLVNAAAIFAYGYSREEFAAMTLFDLRPVDEAEKLTQFLGDLPDVNFLPEEIWKHRKKNGEEFYVRILAHATVYNGRAARLVMALNVQAQMVAEEQSQALTRTLTQKNKYLESLLNSQANLAIVRLDVDGQFTYLNDAFCRRYGYKAAELIGQHVMTVSLPDDLLPIMEMIKRCIAQPGTPYYANFRMVHRDTNETYEVDFEFISITDDEGKPMEVQGIGQDATEKASYIRQITEYSRQQEAIMASIQDVVWSARVSDHTIQYISPASEVVYGYSPADFKAIPKLGSLVVHPDDKALVKHRLQEILRNGSGTIEYRILHAKGEVRHIMERIVVVNDDHGRPSLMNGVSTDVTALREAERIATISSKQLSDVLESITDGFFATDKDWNMIYLNKLFEQANNVRREDLLGKNLWEAYPQLVGRRLWTEYHRAMQEQVTVHFEEYYDYADSWYDITAYPNPEGLAVYFTDITQKKKYEQTILDQNSKLREIAWIQSHKVRAPVARILGLLQIFDRNAVGDPANLELLHLMEQEARGLDVTINDVVRKSNEAEALAPQEPR